MKSTIFEFDRNIILTSGLKLAKRMCGLTSDNVNKASSKENFINQSVLEAFQYVEKVFDPIGSYTRVPYEIDQDVMVINNNIKIKNNRLMSNLTPGSEFYLYGLTCGYDSTQLLKEMNNDYALHHFQFFIGRALLLEMGKVFFKSFCQLKSNLSLKRYAIFPKELQNKGDLEEDVKSFLWSPEDIIQFAPLLNNDRFQLKTNETGCFTPLFSLMGLMMGSAK